MIAVAAATGKLARHVVRALLERVPVSELVLAVRSPSKAKAFAQLGVQVRHGDYDEPASLLTAFAGISSVLLISSSEQGQCEQQHTNAVQAGVESLAYTSVFRVGHSPWALAGEHRATEDRIRESGIPHSPLRNGWYLESYTKNPGGALATGNWLGAAGKGRIVAASRLAFEQAAVEVIFGERESRVYEQCGDEEFALTELADAVPVASRKYVRYQDILQATYRGALASCGFPTALATMPTDSDAGISRRQLDGEIRDSSRLLRRPITALSTALRWLCQRSRSCTKTGSVDQGCT